MKGKVVFRDRGTEEKSERRSKGGKRNMLRFYLRFTRMERIRNENIACYLFWR